jgi:hypothetical protein
VADPDDPVRILFVGSEVTIDEAVQKMTFAGVLFGVATAEVVGGSDEERAAVIAEIKGRLPK